MDGATIMSVPCFDGVLLDPIAASGLSSSSARRELLFSTEFDMEAYLALFKVIADDAAKHQFYACNIQIWYKMAALGNVQYAIYYEANWGWALVKEDVTWVEVEYVFVYPEARRRGWFRRLVAFLTTKQKELTVCTREALMVRALHALGFKMETKRAGDGSLMFTRAA